jgi:hypothetical protein
MEMRDSRLGHVFRGELNELSVRIKEKAREAQGNIARAEALLRRSLIWVGVAIMMTVCAFSLLIWAKMFPPPCG